MTLEEKLEQAMAQCETLRSAVAEQARKADEMWAPKLEQAMAQLSLLEKITERVGSERDAALARAAMLESALHRAFLKWEPHGGPHAAAEHCGNQTGPCVCDLQELEDLALSPSDVSAWLSDRDARHAAERDDIQRRLDVAVRDRTEMVDALKWERVAFEERRKRLDFTEAELAKVTAELKNESALLEQACDRQLELVSEALDAEADAEALAGALRDAAQTFRQTHVNHCSEAWTSRGLHATECFLADAMDIDAALASAAVPSKVLAERESALKARIAESEKERELLKARIAMLETSP